MEHDDARDPERRADDATPPDQTPDEISEAAPDAPSDAVSGSTWPQEDVAPSSEAADTWPERVEPVAEAATAWPAQDRNASDLADTASHEAVPAAVPAGPPPSEAEAFDAGATEPAAPAEAAHVVPATNVSESTRCPRCGTENRPGLAFCSNCGQRLVAAGASATVERPGTPEGSQACPRCGTHNRAGVAFCQNCGANLRATTAPAGYVPPAVETERGAAALAGEQPVRRGAILGPIVLLIGAIGIAVGWLLPFPYGGGSLFDRALSTGGTPFWSGISDFNGSFGDQLYFYLAAAAPILVILLVVLAVAGFVRAAPGTLQRIGLGLSVIWALGLVVLFGVAEVFASWSGDIVGLLRDLSPGGIIFFLASLIVLIGTLTRFAKS